ncbi:Putative RTA1 like protein [[Torrubiella] hemipterigena]|uniref:Putative RTA1 like protein n=1 Tax=[Torrubiella] hemipterigena TaxID=1531966 RepID=A0A0A1T640_9HYPO|nr:Putative RTA1 like protein [[Torrubiella] hemipterigena]
MDSIMHVARAKNSVSAADCRVETTVLGYYPNLGSGYFFTIMFGLCLIGTVVQGVRFKTWSYMGALTCGLILETAGYVGRILLHKNPCNEGAFELQICAIILAPTFICVSIYLTLKHAAAALSPSTSRIRPVWYPRIFLPGDLSCLIVQAIGGGIAAAAGRTNRHLQESGNRAIIAGVVLQVIVLAIFGIMGVDYLVRVSKYMKTDKARQTEGYRVWNDRRVRIFFSSVSVAYLSVLIRCIYRVAEMAGGWGNKIMQDEPSFLVLDSTLVLVTAALLTIFHPGIYFPRMINGGTKIDGDQLIDGAEQERKNSPHDTSDEGPRSDV